MLNPNPQNQTLDVASLIRELRSVLKLTQEKFAGRLGVSVRTVNRWENGQTIPSPLAMEKIRDLLQQHLTLANVPKSGESLTFSCQLFPSQE